MAQTHERECAVCTNDFTTPKILPCGHLLCRECVISWMDSKPGGGCPLCRCPIAEQSTRSSAVTVDALPTDFVMEALVESARVLSKHHVCCVCDDVKADFICMQCQDMLCSSCAKIHKKMSISRNHDVESLSTVTPERLAASRPALCADHGDKPADSFCFYHRLAVCKSCKSNKHGECPKICELDDEIESAENSLNDLTKILVEAEQKLEQAIGQLTSRLQEVDVSEQEDMAQVDKTCNRLQKLVEDFRKKMKEKTRMSHLKIMTSLRDLKTDLNNRLGKVTSHKHIVTRSMAIAPRPALIHMRQTLTDRVNSLDPSADLKAEVQVKPLSSVECCEEVVERIEKELLMLEHQKTKSKSFSLSYQYPPTKGVEHQAKTSLPSCSFKGKEAIKESQFQAQPLIPVFHSNCGTNIRLTNCNTTAEREVLSDLGNGVLVSRDAMVSNVLYEVRVDAVVAKNGTLLLGVTRIPPARLAMTPCSEDLGDSIIIAPNLVYHQGKRILNTIGEDLERLCIGSRVGLLVDSSNDLHLYIDGRDQGVAAKRVTQPCFAVFDLFFTITKVATLPTSRRT